MFIGSITYCTGLWNAEMLLHEKGYYLTVLLFGLFAAVSLQKAVRDRLEGIRVTGIYFGISWLSLALALLLLTVGLWNAEMPSMVNGCYAMSHCLSIFAAVAVQKNVRDLALFDDETEAAVREA